jgi:hypothetical protein
LSKKGISISSWSTTSSALRGVGERVLCLPDPANHEDHTSIGDNEILFRGLERDGELLKVCNARLEGVDEFQDHMHAPCFDLFSNPLRFFEREGPIDRNGTRLSMF